MKKFSFKSLLSRHITKVISLMIVTSACVYLFINKDPFGAAAFAAPGVGLKGWQNEVKRRTNNRATSGDSGNSGYTG